MKKNHIIVLALLMVMTTSVFAIEISVNDSARLDVVSRTSFGIDLDHPYRYGLSNDITQLDLVFGLASYQKLSNMLNTPDAVGFIELTLFHLDLIKIASGLGYSAPAGIGTNRFQMGEFLVGIKKGPWLFQLNAAGNEPFSSPWNKGMQFVNDGFKLSWAYLDSMVDVRRILAITGVPALTRRGEENMAGDGQTQEHATMKQYGFDAVGNIADRFGPSIGGQMVAAMFNNDDFGINVKFGTEHPFYSENITEDDQNGLALGIDALINPSALSGLKIFASVMGTYKYSFDDLPTPLYGGTRIGYNIPLNDDLSFEPWVGFDIGAFFKDEDVSFAYEGSAGFTMRWPGQSGWLTDYIMNSDGRVFPGMSLGYKIYSDPENFEGMEHSLKFTLFEPKGDDGLFYMLGSEIIVDLVNITGVASVPKDEERDPVGDGFRLLVTAYFDAEFNNPGALRGTLRPWTILYYDNLPEAEGDSRYNNVKVDLGLNFENVIRNTVFGFVWNSGSLLRKIDVEGFNTLGYVRLFVEIKL